MCLGSPPKQQAPVVPSAPPPEPEFNDETKNPAKDRLKKQADGTKSLRIDRTRTTTGDKRAGLQVQRPGNA